ncbi:hypothetical protein LC653_07120 [Nostoc sp. CHAB 5784]|uniref:hypothetical protein n=1 Tax=Nostoc mirabile TaxID=2907820 RepID=UPI001E3D4EBF|nr:hypothetical protein [Nostoc mirabile]MCC5663700.1 hypothetical protein [Nostoc mirabile CHAB5784]
MTISLFSGDAGRSLLIRRRMDSYGEVSRRQEADKINNPVGLNLRQGSREQGARGIEKNWDVALRRCSVTTPPVALASRSLREPRLLFWGSQTHVPPFIPRQFLMESFPQAFSPLSPNPHSVGAPSPPASSLNAVNLQPAAYEVFHVRS